MQLCHLSWKTPTAFVANAHGQVGTCGPGVQLTALLGCRCATTMLLDMSTQCAELHWANIPCCQPPLCVQVWMQTA
eukprot:1153289-Pelagomonas_calceolata.AAC.6